MPRTGRPSKYTVDLADRICELIATSDRGLDHILREENLPASSAVRRWLAARPDFQAKYIRAREQQAELLASQILAIADDSSADTVTRYREDGTEYQAVDHDHINRSRLRVEARKWLASKLFPKVYGEFRNPVQAGDGSPVLQLVVLPAGARVPDSLPPAIDVKALPAGENRYTPDESD